MMTVPEDVVRELSALRPSPLERCLLAADPALQEVSDPNRLCRRPKVTVQMVTYNHEAFIAEAVESVIAQRCDFDFELLIGEDCSTDATRSLCLALQKKYPEVIRVFYSNRNVGGIANVNRLRHLIRGEYLAFCDGDDYWQSRDKLAEQVRFLERRPDVGFVFGPYDELWQGSGERIRDLCRITGGDATLPSDDETIRALVEHRIIPLTVTVMVKSALYHKCVETYEVLQKNFTMSDTQLWIACAYETGCAYQDRTFTTYRRVETSVTRNSCSDRKLTFVLDGAIMLLTCVTSFVKCESLRRELYRWVVRIYSVRLLRAVQEGASREVRRQVLRSLGLLAVQTDFYTVGDKLRLAMSMHPLLQRGFVALSRLYVALARSR